MLRLVVVIVCSVGQVENVLLPQVTLKDKRGAPAGAGADVMEQAGWIQTDNKANKPE